jgi:homoserine kinase
MSIRVFAPISIGNVSVGFDILGLAVVPIDGSLIGDIVQIDQAQNDDLLVIGSHAHRLPKNKTENIVWDCLLTFNARLQQQNIPCEPVQITLEKNIPSSSGLGSSACSVVAALFALNEYYEQPFNKQKLLQLMVELEAQISGSKHYDNVAPCYLGGLQLILENNQNISQSIPTFDDCYWIMAYPDVLISTKAARDILPKMFDRQTTISFGQNLAGFIDASYRQDKMQAFSFLTDVLAEPHRKHLLPNFDKAKEMLLSEGCYAVGISGSGPTLFAVTDNLRLAKKCTQWLSENYLQTEDGFVTICKADKLGTRRI